MVAGLIDFAINWRGDVFGGAPQASSATSFGTLGITFRARNPRDDREWEEAARAQVCATLPSPQDSD